VLVVVVVVVVVVMVVVVKVPQFVMIHLLRCWFVTNKCNDLHERNHL
jgi:hypothetical protein